MDSFTVSTVLPGTAQAIYKAWLSSKGHSEMTGGEAKCSARAGGKFTAWDGYISGKNLELVPGEKIAQSWRTTEFDEGDADSRLEVALAATKGGTKVTLKHSELPAGSGASYKDGWREHYFAPMKEYFASVCARRQEKEKMRRETQNSDKNLFKTKNPPCLLIQSVV